MIENLDPDLANLRLLPCRWAYAISVARDRGRRMVSSVSSLLCLSVWPQLLLLAASLLRLPLWMAPASKANNWTGFGRRRIDCFAHFQSSIKFHDFSLERSEQKT